MPDIFERLVRDLAESDPVCQGVGWESDQHCFVCMSDHYIYKDRPDGKASYDVEDFIHEHDCLWVRARRALNMDNPPSRVLDDPIETTAKEKPDFSGYLTVAKVPTGDGRNYIEELRMNLAAGGYLVGFLTNSKFVGMELKDGYRVVFHFLVIN